MAVRQAASTALESFALATYAKPTSTARARHSNTTVMDSANNTTTCPRSVCRFRLSLQTLISSRSSSVVRRVVQPRWQDVLAQETSDRSNGFVGVEDFRHVNRLVDLGSCSGWECGGASDLAPNLAGGND